MQLNYIGILKIIDEQVEKLKEKQLYIVREEAEFTNIKLKNVCIQINTLIDLKNLLINLKQEKESC